MSIKPKKVMLEADELPESRLQPDNWGWQLKNTIKEIQELDEVIPLREEEAERAKKVILKYPFRITPYYLSLIDKEDPYDAIRLQCMPSEEELRAYADIENDPLGEEKDTVLPGLIHRYPDRVLITLTNMCPVYCRHCTRKRSWQSGSWVRKPEELEAIYQYISGQKGIRDVILSGGDPLLLSNAKLDEILRRLREIPHVEIIRIGTRCPVVLPQRIDNELVSVLKKYRVLWLNTHFNHPNEITKESSEACNRILCAGIPINNQTVLLKGVNDNVTTMTNLCQGLLKIGVRPYYLFQCDPVSGTGHFRTSIEKGLEIIKGMRGFTSGLAVPTFVVDGLHGQGKIPLQPPDYLIALKKDYALLKGYKGETFKYHNPQGE